MDYKIGSFEQWIVGFTCPDNHTCKDFTSKEDLENVDGLDGICSEVATQLKGVVQESYRCLGGLSRNTCYRMKPTGEVHDGPARYFSITRNLSLEEMMSEMQKSYQDNAETINYAAAVVLGVGCVAALAYMVYQNIYKTPDVKESKQQQLPANSVAV